MGRWVFAELSRAAVRREPSEEFLFRTEQIGEGEYAGTDALVREILQNSMDARAGRDPVRVRMAIHQPDDAPPPERLARYFERLREPLAARQLDFDEHGVPRFPCAYFVCEDFGTCGLEGDTEVFLDPPPAGNSRQDFYWFWRNIGRSNKTGEDLGRWGLGKTVYRAVSRIRCMFGLTVRKSDQRRLLMGQAVLSIHRRDNKEYMPEGYWCGAQNDDGLPLPIEDKNELDQFCRDWRLTRRTEPGLSVVSPFIPDELDAERLVQAVAVHFFITILRGDLIVEVMGPGIGSVTLDGSSIEDVCKRIKWDGPKRAKRHVPPPIAFAKRCLQVEKPLISSQVLGRETLPRLTEEAFPQQALIEARQLFASGQLVSLQVSIWLPRCQGDGQEGSVRIFLQRLSDGSRCDTYYVREGMTIPKINSRSAQRGIQALVLVDRNPLAKLLGDTEGPAHEDWETSGERPNREWKHWKGRVNFIRGIVDTLVEILTPPEAEPDFDWLSDFFSIERIGGPQHQRKPAEETPEQAGSVQISSEPEWFRVTPLSNGFTISCNPNVSMPGNAALKVAVAYDLPQGNPLRNWSPIDFRIGDSPEDLKPHCHGCQIKFETGNIVLLQQIEPGFRLTITGFDQHRDLFVRVDDISQSEETTS